MLINSSRKAQLTFESIHNYYEPLVIEEVLRNVPDEIRDDHEFLEDVVCVALNALPARYVRHDVDMAFFMSGKERIEMMDAIRQAVVDAYELVARHRGEKRTTRYGEDTP